MGNEKSQYVPPYPSTGQVNKYQVQGATQASGVAQTSQRGKSMGRGRGQSVQAGTLGTQAVSTPLLHRLRPQIS